MVVSSSLEESKEPDSTTFDEGLRARFGADPGWGLVATAPFFAFGAIVECGMWNIDGGSINSSLGGA